MNITPRLKKEVVALVGGTLFAYVVLALCGANKTAFATAPSTFGAILLILASRSFVAALVNKNPESKKSA